MLLSNIPVFIPLYNSDTNVVAGNSNKLTYSIEMEMVNINALAKRNSKNLIALFFAIIFALVSVSPASAAGGGRVEISADKSKEILYATMYAWTDVGGVLDEKVSIEKKGSLFWNNKVTMNGNGAYYFYSNDYGTYRAVGTFRDPEAVFFGTITLKSKSITV